MIISFPHWLRRRNPNLVGWFRITISKIVFHGEGEAIQTQDGSFVGWSH